MSTEPAARERFPTGARSFVIEADVEAGMRTTITFVDLNDGRTEVITHQTNVPAAYLSAEARIGFTTSLDRFDVYVAGLGAEQEHQQE